jgi:hypothetical protein
MDLRKNPAPPAKPNFVRALSRHGHEYRAGLLPSPIVKLYVSPKESRLNIHFDDSLSNLR